ncbi:hypothetical protein D3C78_1499080 [compost metagenome]
MLRSNGLCRQHPTIYCRRLQVPLLYRCLLYILALYSRIRQKSFLQQLRGQMTHFYDLVAQMPRLNGFLTYRIAIDSSCR